MHGEEPHPSAIDAVLDGAEVLAGEYRDYDAVDARERIARSLAGAAGGTASPSAPEPPVLPGPPFPSEHERARHELDLACAMVLNAPQAGRSLSRLADRERTDPEGALVFACLLHFTGREEAARFWWQFGAGGGSRTAAYCLYLYHRRHGEFRDADYWREQSRRLGAPAGDTPSGRAESRPLLPAAVRRDILARCHRGASPHLPLALEAVINRLRVEADDEYFGEIPQPSGRLARDLTEYCVFPGTVTPATDVAGPRTPSRNACSARGSEATSRGESQ